MGFKEKIATAFLSNPGMVEKDIISPTIIKFIKNVPKKQRMEVMVAFVGLLEGANYSVSIDILFNKESCVSFSKGGEVVEFIASNPSFEESNVALVFETKIEEVLIKNHGIHEINVTLFNNDGIVIDSNSYFFVVIDRVRT
ncbi:hypothetical protein Q4R42_17390 [Morganella morganii subsp. sibonii]